MNTNTHTRISLTTILEVLTSRNILSSGCGEVRSTLRLRNKHEVLYLLQEVHPPLEVD